MQLTRSTPGTSTKHDFWQLVRQLAALASETRVRLHEEDQSMYDCFGIGTEEGPRPRLLHQRTSSHVQTQSFVLARCHASSHSSLPTHCITQPYPIARARPIEMGGGTTRQGSLDSHDGRGSDLHRWCLRVRAEDKRTSKKPSGKHFEAPGAPVPAAPKEIPFVLARGVSKAFRALVTQRTQPHVVAQSCRTIMTLITENLGANHILKSRISLATTWASRSDCSRHVS